MNSYNQMKSLHYVNSYIIWIHTLCEFIQSDEFTSLCEFIYHMNSYIIWILTIKWIHFIMWIHTINEFTSLCEFIQSDEFRSLYKKIIHHMKHGLFWRKSSLINLSGMPLVPREVLQVYQANWCVAWAFIRFDIVKIQAQNCCTHKRLYVLQKILSQLYVSQKIVLRLYVSRQLQDARDGGNYNWLKLYID